MPLAGRNDGHPAKIVVVADDFQQEASNLEKNTEFHWEILEVVLTREGEERGENSLLAATYREFRETVPRMIHWHYVCNFNTVSHSKHPRTAPYQDTFHRTSVRSSAPYLTVPLIVSKYGVLVYFVEIGRRFLSRIVRSIPAA